MNFETFKEVMKKAKAEKPLLFVEAFHLQFHFFKCISHICNKIPLSFHIVM